MQTKPRRIALIIATISGILLPFAYVISSRYHELGNSTNVTLFPQNQYSIFTNYAQIAAVLLAIVFVIALASAAFSGRRA